MRRALNGLKAEEAVDNHSEYVRADEDIMQNWCRLVKKTEIYWIESNELADKFVI